MGSSLITSGGLDHEAINITESYRARRKDQHRPTPDVAYMRDEIFTEQQLWILPEKALLLAMLEDAIMCLRHVGSKNERWARLAGASVEWMTEEAHDVFSFNFICEALNLDPSAVRKRYKTALKEGERTARAYTTRRIVVPPDPNASHAYVSSLHCNECQRRYKRQYSHVNPPAKVGAPKKKFIPTHEFVTQHHCKDCRRIWSRDYKERMRGGNPTIELKKRGRKPKSQKFVQDAMIRRKPAPMILSEKFLETHVPKKEASNG